MRRYIDDAFLTKDVQYLWGLLYPFKKILGLFFLTIQY